MRYARPPRHKIAACINWPCSQRDAYTGRPSAVATRDLTQIGESLSRPCLAKPASARLVSFEERTDRFWGGQFWKGIFKSCHIRVRVYHPKLVVVADSKRYGFSSNRSNSCLNIITRIIHGLNNRITVVTRIQYTFEDLYISLPADKQTPRTCSLNTHPSTVYITWNNRLSICIDHSLNTIDNTYPRRDIADTKYPAKYHYSNYLTNNDYVVRIHMVTLYSFSNAFTYELASKSYYLFANNPPSLSRAAYRSSRFSTCLDLPRHVAEPRRK